MINLVRLTGLALAVLMTTASLARADGIGPHWTSDQLRAARDLDPVAAVRFRLHRVHTGAAGKKVSDTEIVLAPSFTFMKTGAQSVLYDHTLCRWLTWPAATGGLSNINCHALPYFFGVEMQNRQMLGKLMTDAGGKALSLYEAETELHLSAGGTTLARTPTKGGSDYAVAGKRMVRVSGDAGALQPDELHRVVRLLALTTPVHPEVRRDIAAAARLPGSIEMDGLGPGQNEHETIVFSRIERARIAYPLPPGLTPEIDRSGWSKDAAMTAAVGSVAAALRDPASRPEPTIDDLVGRATTSAAAHNPIGVVFSYFTTVQLYSGSVNTPAVRTRLQPMLTALAPALKDPRAAALWEASRLAGDGSAKGDRQAAARTLLDVGADAGDLADFRDITLGNLLLVSKDREQWDPALRARLPDSTTTCFWRSIAAAPWPANTYHDLGIALLGDYQIDVAWLAFDLGRAIDPTWKGGVMASIADAEQRLEHNLPDFF